MDGISPLKVSDALGESVELIGERGLPGWLSEWIFHEISVLHRLPCNFVNDCADEVCLERPFGHLKVFVHCSEAVGILSVLEAPRWGGKDICGTDGET